MPVVLVHQGPTLTQERYEEVVRKVTGGRSRLETPADWPVEGLLVHAAGQGKGGFRVVDVWESEGAAAKFGEILDTASANGDSPWCMTTPGVSVA